MSHGVSKEAYVGADPKTSKELTFDILDHLDTRIDEMIDTQVTQVALCNTKFDDIEDKSKSKKKKDTALAASTGLGGGVLVMAIQYIKNWLGQ